MSPSFLDWVSFAPMCPPMRVMDMSEPRVKSPMPRTSSAEAIRKESISPASTGTSSRHSAATTPQTGSTEAAASRSFSSKIR